MKDCRIMLNDDSRAEPPGIVRLRLGAPELANEHGEIENGQLRIAAGRANTNDFSTGFYEEFWK